MSKGRTKLRIRERQLVLRALNWDYDYGLQRKNEWLDLPEFVRGNKSFSTYLESILTEIKRNGTSQGLAH